MQAIAMFVLVFVFSCAYMVHGGPGADKCTCPPSEEDMKIGSECFNETFDGKRDMESVMVEPESVEPEETKAMVRCVGLKKNFLTTDNKLNADEVIKAIDSMNTDEETKKSLKTALEEIVEEPSDDGTQMLLDFSEKAIKICRE